MDGNLPGHELDMERNGLGGQVMYLTPFCFRRLTYLCVCLLRFLWNTSVISILLPLW